MSDRMVAEIEVGGPVPRGLAPELIEQIRASGAFVTWEEVRFGATTAEELVALAKRTSEHGTLLLADFEASGGRFEALEEFLVKHGIAFDRRSEARAEYDAELYQFRPDLEKPRLWLADQIGRPAILVSNLDGVRTALERAHCEEARQLLDVLLGPVIPPLTPLRTDA